jgi:hypothetical protein
MALPTARLVVALRETAARLRSADVVYKWSHFGHCNCGHLAQTITRRPAREIYEAAFVRSGDWGQQARELELPDYGDRPAIDEGAFEHEGRELCAATGSPLEQVLAEMYAVGLDREDIDHLEDLSDGEVLRFMGASTTGLTRHAREDVVRYLEAWALILERRLTELERARLEALAPAAEDLAVAAEE